ncbi:MAG: zf-HC2 domain-containing protein [Planctomycetes bacterium]|nr:zf-HC2 domain-containing protein [Planctomycetota bacterium]
MECAKTRELIGPYLDNELSADELSRVKTHLADCADCRRELAELEQVKGLVRSLPRHPASKALIERMEQFNKPVQTSFLLRYRPAISGGTPPMLRWLIPSIATAAAAVLVVYVSIISLPHYQNKTAKPPASEVAEIAPAAPPAKPAPEETIGLEYDKLSKDGAEGRIAKKGGDIETAPNDSIANAPEEMRHKETRAGKGGRWDEGAAEQGLRQQEVLDDKSTVKSQTAIAPKVTQREEKKESEKEEYADETAGNMQFGAKQKALDQIKETSPQPAAITQGKSMALAKNELAAKSPEKKAMRSLKTADTVVWQTGPLSDIIKQTNTSKKLVLAYLYFPPNDYDKIPIQYDQEQALFARIFVPMAEESTALTAELAKTVTQSRMKAGRITDPQLAELFDEYKLPYSTQCLVLDYYGNLIQVVSSPFSADNITAALDAAAGKVSGIETVLNKSYNKAEEFGKSGKTPEQIRVLQQIGNMPYRGYPPITNAQNTLNALNQQAITRQNNIMQNRQQLSRATQDKEADSVVKELEDIARDYKGLPAEKEAQENIKRVRQSQTPTNK